jgi:hypothetical protein
MDGAVCDIAVIAGYFGKTYIIVIYHILGGECMNVFNIVLGVVTAVVYAFLGFAAQDKPFDSKRFLRTFAIALLSAFGLDVSGLSVDVYAAALSPTAVTVFIQKLIDTARLKA